jgi:hypothetical protein
MVDAIRKHPDVEKSYGDTTRASIGPHVRYVLPGGRGLLYNLDGLFMFLNPKRNVEQLKLPGGQKGRQAQRQE